MSLSLARAQAWADGHEAATLGAPISANPYAEPHRVVTHCPECSGLPHHHEPWCYVGNGRMATARPTDVEPR